MSSRRDALLALAGAGFALAGCGFAPLYGDVGGHGPVGRQLASIGVDVIAEREGQLLRGFLIERLNPNGRPADPAYRLQVQLRETQRDLGVQEDDTSTRANLTLIADFRLIEAAGETEVHADSVATTTAFNILDDQFATLVAERDARARALRAMSEAIRTELALYFARQNADAA